MGTRVTLRETGDSVCWFGDSVEGCLTNEEAIEQIVLIAKQNPALGLPVDPAAYCAASGGWAEPNEHLIRATADGFELTPKGDRDAAVEAFWAEQQARETWWHEHRRSA